MTTAAEMARRLTELAENKHRQQETNRQRRKAEAEEKEIEKAKIDLPKLFENWISQINKAAEERKRTCTIRVQDDMTSAGRFILKEGEALLEREGFRVKAKWENTTVQYSDDTPEIPVTPCWFEVSW